MDSSPQIWNSANILAANVRLSVLMSGAGINWMGLCFFERQSNQKKHPATEYAEYTVENQTDMDLLCNNKSNHPAMFQ